VVSSRFSLGEKFGSRVWDLDLIRIGFLHFFP
jgi:hypothetical protein